MNIKINLLLAGAAFGLWYAFLKPKKSRELEILETIPAYQTFKKKAFVNLGIEAAKMVAIYFALGFTPLAKIGR